MARLVLNKMDPEMQKKIERILTLSRYIEEVRATQRELGGSAALDKQEAALVMDLYKVLTNTHTAAESFLPEDDTPE